MTQLGGDVKSVVTTPLSTQHSSAGRRLPPRDRAGDGGAGARWADLAAMARRAEELGFDSVWVADHLIFRFDGKPPQAPWECWSLLAALAAVTSRIELGPLVSCTGFRDPALLAKMADTVDEISGGRWGTLWVPRSRRRVT